MAERFYCPDASAHAGAGRALELVGDEARHLRKVLRVEVGAFVEVFDGNGFATRAEVVSMEKDRVELKAEGPPLPGREPLVQITLATAVPKGERLDWLVEKATELGVSRLVPLLTERSVVDPREGKLDRLRRAVIEASKQCGRNRLMEIDRPTPWADLLIVTGEDDVRLTAHPGRRRFAAWPLPRAGKPVVVAVGPEGGFTDSEIEAARAAGWVAVGLGAPLLRIETAGIAACARVLALAESGIEEGEGWDA
jgi:16S rRNA (uracil1498-N3)-methyltransferase